MVKEIRVKPLYKLTETDRRLENQELARRKAEFKKRWQSCAQGDVWELIHENVPIESACRSAAILEFVLNQDKEKCKRYFNYIAQMLFYIFKYNKEHNEELAVDAWSGNVNGYAATNMISYALLSGNNTLVKSCLPYFYDLEDLNKRVCTRNYAYIPYFFKYALLDDGEKLAETIERFRYLTGLKTCGTFERIVMEIMTAIYENDAPVVNERLIAIRRSYRMLHECICLKYFSPVAVALAIVAVKRGIEVTVDTDTVPADLIDLTELQYVDIYAALHKSN